MLHSPMAWGRWPGQGRKPTISAEGRQQEPKISPPSATREGHFRGDTHVGVAVTQDLVQDMAELPAEDGTAGQGQPNGVGPEGECSLLVVRPQDDPFPVVKANRTHTGAGDMLGWALFLFNFHEKGDMHRVYCRHRDHQHNAAPADKTPIYFFLVHLPLLQGALGPFAFYCQRNAI